MPPRRAQCTSVVTLPQTSPICWFTALLMALFYSDGLRQLWQTRYMATWARISKTRSARAPLLGLLHRLVASHYSARTLLQQRRVYAALESALAPETLLRLLHAYAPQRFPVATPMGYSSELYLTGICDLLGVRSVGILDAVPHSEGTWRLHARQLTTKQPPLLIIHVRPSATATATTHSEVFDVPDLSLIRLGGARYTADAVLLSNMNMDTCQRAHKIAGITCAGQRYIYNGWVLDNGRACPLFPYDWLAPDARAICLSQSACELRPRGLWDRFFSGALCFRPLEGECTLLYVKA